ncbi:MAG: hypothetical protein LBG80_03965, partial [Bacteroidales bacterium]|nr:hypothetical protein [Bacteroidales bacterium]
FFNLIIFSVVLGIYSLKILGIFLIASVLYILWIVLFLKKRKELDYKRFAQASAEQSNLYQMTCIFNFWAFPFGARNTRQRVGLSAAKSRLSESRASLLALPNVSDFIAKQ